VHSGEVKGLNVKAIVGGIVGTILIGWLVLDFIPSASIPGWASAMMIGTLLLGDALYWVGLVVAEVKQ